MHRLLLVLLTLAAAPAYAQYAGHYAVTGTNPDGNPYEATLNITQRGPIHFFGWNEDDRLNDYAGASIHEGDVIAVAFNEDGCGVALYRMEGGSLEGFWASAGSEQFGTERAERTSSGRGLAGEYTISGDNHGGSEYSGELSIVPHGGLYAMTWTTGSVGIGVPIGDHLAAVYGGRECGLAAYQVEPDGTLNGTWGLIGGAGAIGTERAVRR